MAKSPIRRSQLIAPFGVGAMTVIQGGIGLITAGLDHWYKREDNDQSIDISEYKMTEWRLQRLLNVDHFRLPPDYRERMILGQEVPNTGLTIPFLRFPKWHFCPRCHRLEEIPLSARGRIRCPECQKANFLFQVPFVAMCQAGHLQDFPWREWVHKDAHPQCKGTMRLVSTGSASLSGQKVKCECGATRDLGSIMQAEPDGTTFLSKNLLDNGNIFFCQGKKPWLASEEGEACGQHLRGSLRSSSNIYFAQVKSAIYLPREGTVAPEDLVSLFERPPLSTYTETLLDATDDQDPDTRWKKIVAGVRKLYAPLVDKYSDEQIRKAGEIVFGLEEEPQENPEDSSDIESEDKEAQFRWEEYQVLRKPRQGNLLNIKEIAIQAYEPLIANAFDRILLIDKLRETRAMAGFTRVFAENGQSRDERLSMLRLYEGPEDNWLPASIVYGEGIYFELKQDRLQYWEQNEEIVKRIKKLDERFKITQQKRRLRQQSVTPRFVLLHTLAHLIMNRLTFECGYSSAALRERLYVSSNKNSLMAGILIYTADGDTEGTMGGLVRMGKPGYIESVIRRALQNAIWCSADPVCMECTSSKEMRHARHFAKRHFAPIIPNNFKLTLVPANAVYDAGLGCAV